jgi:hypothetical protein
LDALRTNAHVSHAQVFGDRLHVWSTAPDAPAAMREFEQLAAQAGVVASGVRQITPSLEDVFISKLTV